jgi:acetolactate synthase-1/2/3 large subunit
MMGLTSMDSGSFRYLGMSGMHGRFAATNAFTKTDLVIAAGVRFTDRATGNKEHFAENAKIIHIDIDSAEHGKNITADIKICGSLQYSLEHALFGKVKTEKQKLSIHAGSRRSGSRPNPLSNLKNPAE